MESPVVLGVISHEDGHERLEVTLRNAAGGNAISLNQQSWADGVGWFTQSSVELTPDQLRQLKAVLGPAVSPAAPRRSATARIVQPQPVAETPVAISIAAYAHAESA